MSETQFPPPRPSGTSVSTPNSGDRPILRDALVTEAPPKLSQPADTLLLSGKIVGLDRAKGEVRIATPDGTITVQSKIAIPPDTEVMVELKMQQLSLRANITVIKQKSAEAEAAQSMAKPAPNTAPAPDQPIRITAGTTTTALRLPPDTPAQQPSTTQTVSAETRPAPSQPLTLADAAKIIEAARSVGVAKLPTALPNLPPIPMPILWQVLNTRDVESALVKLPPPMQQQITDFLQRPDVIAALEKIIPPATLGTFYPPPADMAIDAPVTDTTSLATRPPPAAPATTTTTQAAQMTALQGLLPLLETMLPGVASAMQMTKPPAGVTALAAAPLPQNMLRVTVHDVLPAQKSDAQPQATALPHGAVMATVESLTPKGFPILKLPDGHIVLQQAADIEIGTRLAVSTTPMSAADILALSPALSALGSVALPFDPLSSRSWPALQETLQILTQEAAGAATLLKNTLPNPAAASRMTPTALFFLAALRMGSIESWLGDNILQALRQSGRKDLADRLGGDFKNLSTQSKATVAGDWRVISLPVLQDEHIHQIQFYVRQQHDDSPEKRGDGTDKKMTRFILNLTLSRMGDMQLDGLLHKERLDLILRSAKNLPFDIRQQIMQRFTAGIEQVGMQGGISFQTRAEKWAHIDTGAEKSRHI